MLRVNIVTIFPEFFSGPLSLSIPARAAAAGGVAFNVVDLRDFTHDRHRTVDDYPYGGGAGMVMKPDPFFEAVDALGATSPIVLMSARGRRFTQDDAFRFAAGEELTILCGHYKDVDQRVADFLATEELSVGDFVLSGGESAALVVVDATVRLLPGAISDLDSARGDSWFDRVLSAPSYTRPPVFRGHEVPDVLLSGDHKRIEEWRRREGERMTQEREAGGGRREAMRDEGRGTACPERSEGRDEVAARDAGQPAPSAARGVARDALPATTDRPAGLDHSTTAQSPTEGLTGQTGKNGPD